MARSKPYGAVVEVGFHLGELHFLMPFLYSVEYTEGERICLLFTSRRVYEQFRADPVLSQAAAELKFDIRTVFLRQPRLERTGTLRSGVRFLQRRIALPFLRRRALRLLARTDLYLVQIAGGVAEPVLKSQSRIRPAIVRFPHSSAPQLVNMDEARRQTMLPPRRTAGEPILLWDPEAFPYYEMTGVTRSIVLGYHQLYPKWMSLLSQHSLPVHGHVIVYQYDARDDVLPLPKWIELHRSAYRVIRAEFPGIPIVIKPHPSMDLERVRAFIAGEDWEGVTLAEHNPIVAAIGARFAVGFVTGGIYNAMLLDLPSINYFNAREEYAAAHGSYMHGYSALGVPDVQTEDEFRDAVRRVREGTLTCDFGTRKRQIPLVATFAELRRQVLEP